ncbi:nitrous oxide reductase accessory protein NosL [Halocola ammonii]
MTNRLVVSISAIAFLFLIGCSPSGPEPIQFGKDQCHYCKMTISNPKYGAELITKKGRVYKYDAAECVVNQISEGDIEYSAIYAIAYNKPKELNPVDSLHFIISKDFRSPMGANLAAFSEKDNIADEYQGQLLTWEEVRKSLKE